MSASGARPPRDPELDSLLGAYALDALDEDERARVDAYIETNRLARDEVDELLESAASLALAPSADLVARPELWERIWAHLDESAAGSTVVRPSFWRRPAVAVALAVAAAIAIIVLATQVVVLSNQSSDTGDLAAAFDQALTQKGARDVSLVQADGRQVARAVVLADGTGYLKNDGMTPLPTGQTYQLWTLGGAGGSAPPISAGVLGADPGTIAFHTSGPVGGLGLTVEQAPGAVQPTQPIYASATMGA